MLHYIMKINDCKLSPNNDLSCCAYSEHAPYSCKERQLTVDSTCEQKQTPAVTVLASLPTLGHGA